MEMCMKVVVVPPPPPGVNQALPCTVTLTSCFKRKYLSTQ